MTRYSEAFKDAIINKILAPQAPSIRSIAKENDLPIGTVLNWLKTKNIEVNMENESIKPLTTKEREALETRFKMIVETATMSDEELGAYCRQKGIYVQDIEIWKQEMLDNLDSRNKKVLSTENYNLRIKLRELKAELKCKDKALAESSALLLLKKKASVIWSEIEDES